MTTFEQLPVDLGRFGFSLQGEHDPLDKKRVNEIADWIAPRFDKAQKMCKKRSSYGIKHVVEKYIGYVGNGELIAAMYLCGFKVKRDGINAYFNIDPDTLAPFARNVYDWL